MESPTICTPFLRATVESLYQDVKLGHTYTIYFLGKVLITHKRILVNGESWKSQFPIIRLLGTWALCWVTERKFLSRF